jgi:hypothetical protein
MEGSKARTIRGDLPLESPYRNETHREYRNTWNEVKVTQPTVTDLFGCLYRNKTLDNSLRKNSKTHKFHGYRPIGGFLMQ